MYTERQTKTVITKELIENELLAKSKKSLRGSIIFLLAWAFAVGAIFYAIYNFALKNTDLGWLPYAVYFFCLLIFSFPLFFGGLSLNIAATDMRDIKAGRLAVIADTVYSKEEKPGGYRRNIDDTRFIRVVRLSSLGTEVKVNSVIYDITSDGDVFYAAYFTGRKEKLPQKCYPAKMYEYKE